jgi:hypothetical protein
MRRSNRTKNTTAQFVSLPYKKVLFRNISELSVVSQNPSPQLFITSDGFSHLFLKYSEKHIYLPIPEVISIQRFYWLISEGQGFEPRDYAIIKYMINNIL